MKKILSIYLAVTMLLINFTAVKSVRAEKILGKDELNALLQTNAFNDKSAPIPDNLIPDASAELGNKYVMRNNSDILYECGFVDEALPGQCSQFIYAGSGALSLAGGGYRGFEGGELNSSEKSIGFSAEPGKTYVVSLKLKNASPDGVTPPSFGAAMNDSWGTDGMVTTAEYGAAGMQVSDEWKAFKATLELPQDYDSQTIGVYANTVYLGFPAGTESNAACYIDVSGKDSIYFAEQAATNIKLTSERKDALHVGDVINVTGEVVNQIGTKGTLSQELEWYCLDSSRTSTVTGVTLTKNAAGVQVRIDSLDGLGNGLVIVASSGEYGLVSGISPLTTSKITLYAAPDGNDSGSGAIQNPLATVKGVRDRIRILKAQGVNVPIDVVFGGGKYYFDDTVSFEKCDSGTADSKITYKAADGEKVIFTGAIELDLSKAEEVSDEAILARIREDVRDKIVEIDLNAQNFPYEMESGEIRATAEQLCAAWEYPEVYLDGNEQILAQWPNGNAEYAKWIYNQTNNSFKYTDCEPDSWANAKDWWVGGYMVWDYQYMRLPAVTTDVQNKQINLDVRPGASLFVSEGRNDITHRWKAFNLLEELDVPTEWYIDIDTMKLYYYMPEIKADSVLEISVLKKPMISMHGTEYMEFEGIEFSKTRGSAVAAENIKNISVRECRFTDIGVDAFGTNSKKMAECDKDYWQRQTLDAAYNCEISDCVFFNIGGHAVVLDGGNVDTLTPGNNVIKNSVFSKCAQKIRNYDTILVKGCGNQVIHNNISRTTFQAIRFYGNDHVISYNEVYNVRQEADDSGAIYCGRNTIQRGSVISYNYLHDLFSTQQLNFGHIPAIYWDDMQAGVKAEYNIIEGARINLYTNGIDNEYSHNTSIDITYTNLDIKNGGAACNNDDDSNKRFSGTIADSNLYYSKYANLKTIVESADRKDRTLARYNIVKNNLCVNGPGGNGIGSYTMLPIKGGFLNLQWVSAGNVNNNQDDKTDMTIFVDPSNRDFRVKNSSAEAGLGLLDENFDIDEIGVQGETENFASDIRLVSPFNRAVLSSDTVHFMWNDSFGATKYTVTVARDEQFSNVICTKESYYDFADITLPEGTGTYYWRVTAHNTSREFASDWQSPVYSFTNDKAVVVSAELKDDDAIDLSIINNCSTDDIDAKIYLAEFDNSRTLLNVQSFDKKLAYQEPAVFGGNEIKLQALDPSKVKLLVWNEKLCPLSSAIIVK